MKHKKIIALVLSLITILSSSPLDMLVSVFAGTSPYLPIYGKGTYSDPTDYRQIHSKIFKDKGATVPTSKFAVINKANGNIIGTSATDNTTVTKVEGVPIGTTIKININNLSTVGSGSAIDMVDFQVTKGGSLVSAIQDTPASLGNYELTLNSTGTYNFYLCVRDNTAKIKTDGWGNWSYNGPHQSKGLNYGINDIKETSGTPETAGGDDFWGYWYYAQVQLIVTSDATALFTINYNNNNITDNKDNPLLKSSTNRTLVLRDESVQGIVDPIVSRTWYYWNASTGWTTLAGKSGVTISGDGTTATITDYDANLTNTDSAKKGFKLETTTKSGFKATAQHEAFFRYGSITAYYKDVDTNADLYAASYNSNLMASTQSIAAKAAPSGYTLLTASPQSVTLTQDSPDKAVTFFYKKGAAAPGTGTIIVQYKNKQNPSEDVLPPNNSKTDVPYGTYTITAEPAPSGYIFDSSATPSPQTVVLDSTNRFVLVTFFYVPVGSGGKPPVAVITGPSERMAGDNIIFSGGSSFDPDGTIVDYIWDIPGANIVRNNGRTITVWYPNEGEYDLFLTVVDNDGMIGECMTSIKITPPVPTAAIDITGTLKENRKVTVSGAGSSSPTHYPINKYTWTMTNGAYARYIGTFGSDVSKEMLLKKAQAYQFNLRVDSTYGLSDSESKTITITPDVAPVADFSVTTQVLRDPKNSNTATITATNLSKSTDGDTIKKTVMFYAYDSDNDGDFTDETWYYSKDGTTWSASGLTYSQLDSFDLYNLSGASNPATFTLKTNQVGKYKFECKTIEDIPAADTIPSLLTASDYKTGITLTSKPNSAKIVEVINTAPQVSFTVKKTKPVDILIFTDYAGTKLDGLNSVIAAKTAQLRAIGVDPNFVIVNTSKTIGTQTMMKYRYIRDLHFIFKINAGDATDIWMPSSFPFYKDEGGRWEEKESYDKPLNEIPFGRIYSHYQYINTTSHSGWSEYTRNYYKAYDTAGGYLDISFNTYYNQGGPYYNWTSSSIDSVYADPQWTQDAYLGTDNLNVTSIDIGAIKTTPLRTGSDRYAIFLSEGKSKDYSLAFGNSFAFGSLTEDIKNYVNQNNFKVFTIVDPKTMNTIINKEIGIDVKACEAAVSYNNYNLALYETSNGYYYFYHTKTRKPYMVDSSTFGRVKSIAYPGLILMENGTTKYFDGTSFTNIPVNNIVSVRKIGNSQFIAAITSSGVSIIDAYNNCTVKVTVPLTDIVDVQYGNNEDYGYILIASKSIVKVVNLETSTVVGTYLQNNLISVNQIRDSSIILADSDGIDVIRTSTMALSRTFGISGGVKQLYPKNDLIYFLDGGSYSYGIYVLSNTGRMYRYKDINYDNVLDVAASIPSAFNSYNIKTILDYTGGSANFYMHTTDNKLLYYSHDADMLSVKSSNFPVVEESVYQSGILVRLSDGTVLASYPIVIGGHWQKHKDDDPTWEYDYAQSDFFNVPLPIGVNIKKVLMTPYGMFLFGDDNNLYNIVHASGERVDQSPSVALYKSGVSDVIKNIGGTNPSLFLRLTNGDIYHKYRGLNNYTYEETLSNIKDYVILDNGAYYLLKTDGTSSNNIISTNITMTEPTASYITLNDLVNSNNSSRTYGAGQYTQALNDLAASYTADPSYTTNYILLGDMVNYNVQYADTENDPKYKEYWAYNHDANYFENSLGIADFNAKTLNYPITYFDKTGLFNINLKVRDNPKNDDRFDNYRLYNQGIINANLYVHRRPIALAGVRISPNGTLWNVQAYDAGSYDLDHSSRANKGIVASEWGWKEEYETSWHIERMNKTDCDSDKRYYIRYRVKDLEGAWSDYNSIEIDNDNPPVALFDIDNKVININEKLKVKDRSFPQSFSTITNWHWIVKKLNSDGSVPTTNLQNNTYTNSNNGTGAMTGYDVNVKTDYSTSGAGKYRIYLRVKDSNGLWSDGGTDAVPSLTNFYSRDFEVDRPPAASFTIEKNTIKVDETLKLKDTSAAMGTSPLMEWHWIVKKLNPDGSVPGSDIQNGKFGDSNTGIGELSGYDVNVKTQYADTGPGTYRIYLRVMNGNGMWSDGGTDIKANLDNCFTRDIVVEESLKMSNFRVVRVRDLRLESYYYDSVTGEYDDRPMDVNVMAIDYQNFGGLVDGLTKGYLLEFEIDTVNFNDSTDTIVIMPHFYTCDAYSRDEQERDLYWENSRHEILKAGTGGHSSRAVITLDADDRITTGGKTATWRGSYLIPGTAWAVPAGTTPANAKGNRINSDIIVNFEIKGYKDGVMKYDYNLKQWPLERTTEKWPYKIGDVIRYSHTKSNLDDNNVILNRP